MTEQQMLACVSSVGDSVRPHEAWPRLGRVYIYILIRVYYAKKIERKSWAGWLGLEPDRRRWWQVVASRLDAMNQIDPGLREWT